jgi:hypothetical protein
MGERLRFMPGQSQPRMERPCSPSMANGGTLAGSFEQITIEIRKTGGHSKMPRGPDGGVNFAALQKNP